MKPRVHITIAPHHLKWLEDEAKNRGTTTISEVIRALVQEKIFSVQKSKENKSC